jgi:hypothetical protein
MNFCLTLESPAFYPKLEDHVIFNEMAADDRLPSEMRSAASGRSCEDQEIQGQFTTIDPGEFLSRLPVMV